MADKQRNAALAKKTPTKRQGSGESASLLLKTLTLEVTRPPPTTRLLISTQPLVGRSVSTPKSETVPPHEATDGEQASPTLGHIATSAAPTNQSDCFVPITTSK